MMSSSLLHTRSITDAPVTYWIRHCRRWRNDYTSRSKLAWLVPEYVKKLSDEFEIRSVNNRLAACCKVQAVNEDARDI